MKAFKLPDLGRRAWQEAEIVGMACAGGRRIELIQLLSRWKRARPSSRCPPPAGGGTWHAALASQAIVACWVSRW